MSKLKLIETEIEGLFVIERNVSSDDRGSFYRLFCESELKEIGFTQRIQQINYSYAKEKYTTRGFHFQYQPDSEVKIVTCVKGSIFDVAIDLRKNSPTYLKHFSIELSEDNCKSLFIPEGFAHGSMAIEADSTLVYLHSKSYNSANEGGVNVNDPHFASIPWPGPITNLSERDKSFPLISSDFEGI